MMIRLILFTINHCFLPLKSRRNTQIYGTEKNYKISQYQSMAVIRFQVTVTIVLFPMEEKLYHISPVLQYQNIFLHVLIAREIVFVGKISMPTEMSGISSAFVVTRMSNKDTTCHCSFRFNICALDVTAEVT